MQGQLRVILGSSWSQAGVKLGLSGGQPGVNLRSTWGQHGVTLGSTWARAGVKLGSTCHATPHQAMNEDDARLRPVAECLVVQLRSGVAHELARPIRIRFLRRILRGILHGSGGGSRGRSSLRLVRLDVAAQAESENSVCKRIIIHVSFKR